MVSRCYDWQRLPDEAYHLSNLAQVFLPCLTVSSQTRYKYSQPSHLNSCSTSTANCADSRRYFSPAAAARAARAAAADFKSLAASHALAWASYLPSPISRSSMGSSTLIVFIAMPLANAPTGSLPEPN